MRKFRNVLFGAIVVAGALLLHYSLPFSDVVRIVGTEVVTERVEGDASVDAQGRDVRRDIRYVNAIDADDTPRVYRNVDTGWSWPPYLKFSSADLVATAENATGDDQSWHRVTSYGWRVPIVSQFPNIVAIEPASGPSDTAFPWFTAILFLLYAVAMFMLWRWLFGRRDHDIGHAEGRAAL